MSINFYKYLYFFIYMMHILLPWALHVRRTGAHRLRALVTGPVWQLVVVEAAARREPHAPCRHGSVLQRAAVRSARGIGRDLARLGSVATNPGRWR